MRFFGLLCTIFLLGAGPVFAQDPGAPPPAHISFVEGTATVEHDGEAEAAVLNMPVLEGDRIRTADGRVEVLFADGSSIAIDPDSDVEFLGGTRVRVAAGAIEHRAAADTTSASAQYLPSDLQPYGSDFDQYGSWQYDASYGSVWYPTVAADWRPYYYGYWDSIRPYGWTWIGYDRWSWPTHHYGRWGYARNRWFWIPGRTWAAAWVSWGTAPDYVSWCPLGYDGRPVVALSIGYRSGWNAWTIVPRDRFGIRGYSAHRYAVQPYRLASTTPFLIHRSAPRIDRRGGASGVSSSVAVPRYGRRNGVIDRSDRGRFPGRDRGNTPSMGRADRNPAAIGPPPLVGRSPSYGAASPRDPRDPRDPRAFRSAPSDHPAFRPRYDAPRTHVAPRAEPRAMPPSASPTVPRTYAVPRAQPRAAEPAAPMPGRRPVAPAPERWASPPPQRQASPPPPRPAPQAAPARPARAAGPHAARGGPLRSEGTAVRRPR